MTVRSAVMVDFVPELCEAYNTLIFYLDLEMILQGMRAAQKLRI